MSLPVLIKLSNGGFTLPSILYTSEAVGSFFTLAAYRRMYQTNRPVEIVHSTRRSFNPSIQLMPAAFEAMIVENGFENAANPPSDVPPKIIASGTIRSYPAARKIGTSTG